MRLILSHFGIGDTIAFADLIIRIADGGNVLLPCWKTNTLSTHSIFAIHPNIVVYPVFDEAEALFLSTQYETIGLGHYSGIQRNVGEDLIQWVYRTAGRDPQERFENCEVLKAAAKVEQIDDAAMNDAIKSQCIFLHEDPSREFFIDRSRVPREQWSGLITPRAADDISILSWVRSLLLVGKVHCIDSAFLHLTEAVQHKGQLFYHKYARPHSEEYKCLGQNWTVLE